MTEPRPHPWELGSQARALNRRASLSPRGRCRGHLWIWPKRPFFLPLVPASESSWGAPVQHTPPPPQLYSSASQPQFPLPPGIQQVLGAWGDPELRGRHPWDLLSLSLHTWNMGITFPTRPMSWGLLFSCPQNTHSGQRQDCLLVL